METTVSVSGAGGVHGLARPEADGAVNRVLGYHRLAAGRHKKAAEALRAFDEDFAGRLHHYPCGADVDSSAVQSS